MLPSIRAARPDLVNDLKEAGRGAVARARRAASAGGAGDRAGRAVLRPAGRREPDGAEFHRDADAPISASIIGPILSARGYLAGDRFDDDEGTRRRSTRTSSTTLSSLPGAAAAAVTTSIPGDDGGSDRRLVVDGRTADADEINVQSIGITPDAVRHDQPAARRGPYVHRPGDAENPTPMSR